MLSWSRNFVDEFSSRRGISSSGKNKQIKSSWIVGGLFELDFVI